MLRGTRRAARITCAIRKTQQQHPVQMQGAGHVQVGAKLLDDGVAGVDGRQLEVGEKLRHRCQAVEQDGRASEVDAIADTHDEDVADAPHGWHLRGGHAILGQRNHGAVVEHGQQHNQDGGEEPVRCVDVLLSSMNTASGVRACSGSVSTNNGSCTVTPRHAPVEDAGEQTKGKGDTEGHGNGVAGVGGHALEDLARADDGGCNGRQTSLCEHDISSAASSVGGTSHGNTHICLFQRGGVVDTVTWDALWHSMFTSHIRQEWEHCVHT